MSDARALRKDKEINDQVAGKIVPVFLRSAIESVATDPIRSVRLGRGVRHVEVEAALDRAVGLRARLSPALFDTADRHQDVGEEIRRVSGRHDANATVTRVSKAATLRSECSGGSGRAGLTAGEGSECITGANGEFLLQPTCAPSPQAGSADAVDPPQGHVRGPGG